MQTKPNTPCLISGAFPAIDILVIAVSGAAALLSLIALIPISTSQHKRLSFHRGGSLYCFFFILYLRFEGLFGMEQGSMEGLAGSNGK
jgi:uncharacterized membrane protein YozB (DUF420 family)